MHTVRARSIRSIGYWKARERVKMPSRSIKAAASGELADKTQNFENITNVQNVVK